MAQQKRPRIEGPRRLRPFEQSCKRCGAVDGINFNVPPKIWKAVAGSVWLDSVLCLRCFDQLADENHVDYVRHIKDVIFVGQKGILDFTILRGLERPNWKRVRGRK
jgi:hypothetical protein